MLCGGSTDATEYCLMDWSGCTAPIRPLISVNHRLPSEPCVISHPASEGNGT
jgi:hypothetical protein